MYFFCGLVGEVCAFVVLLGVCIDCLICFVGCNLIWASRDFDLMFYGWCFDLGVVINLYLCLSFVLWIWICGVCWLVLRFCLCILCVLMLRGLLLFVFGCVVPLRFEF